MSVTAGCEKCDSAWQAVREGHIPCLERMRRGVDGIKRPLGYHAALEEAALKGSQLMFGTLYCWLLEDRALAEMCATSYTCTDPRLQLNDRDIVVAAASGGSVGCLHLAWLNCGEKVVGYGYAADAAARAGHVNCVLFALEQMPHTDVWSCAESAANAWQIGTLQAAHAFRRARYNEIPTNRECGELLSWAVHSITDVNPPNSDFEKIREYLLGLAEDCADRAFDSICGPYDPATEDPTNHAHKLFRYTSVSSECVWRNVAKLEKDSEPAKLELARKLRDWERKRVGDWMANVACAMHSMRIPLYILQDIVQLACPNTLADHEVNKLILDVRRSVEGIRPTDE